MKRITLSLVGIVILILAGCSLTNGIRKIPISGLFNPTALMQTVYGQLTVYAPVTRTPRTRGILAPFLAPTLTMSPVPPSVTPFLISPTALLVPTFNLPTLFARVDTNCRSGPGINYPIVGFVQADEIVPLIGRLATNSWWVIQNPRQLNQICWIWSGITTVQGDVSTLPVISQPATPVWTRSASLPTSTAAAAMTPTWTVVVLSTSTPVPTLTLPPPNTPLPTLPPTATPTPAPTATPGPTNTPEPTNTPRPTPTDRPTHTPKPTHTPRPVDGAVALP